MGFGDLTLIELYEALSRLGGWFVVFLGIVALVKGIIRLGREYRALQEDRDFWRKIALDLLDVNKDAIDVARHSKQ